MNWIPVKEGGRTVERFVKLPGGWWDVWYHRREKPYGHPGWTWNTQVCPQKGFSYDKGVSQRRLWESWQWALRHYSCEVAQQA